MTTSAAAKVDNIEEVTPYQLITLLLDGALERIDQAISNLDDGDIEEADILVNKTIGIVGGLRESLNFDAGGEIANNLNTLYVYIIDRLERISLENSIETLSEVKDLLSEVYLGWQEMDPNS